MNGIVQRLVKYLGALTRRTGMSWTQPLSAHPAIEARVKQAIESLPSSVSKPLISDLWVVPVKGFGQGNVIVTAGKRRRLKTRFVIIGSPNGNILFLGKNADAPDEMRWEGNENFALLSDAVTWSRLNLRFASNDGHIAIGRQSIFNGTELVVEGEGKQIVLGDHSLFAPGTVIRTSDMHAISDQATGDWINPPESVELEPYVWVGEDVSILKGVKIGGGSVIGAKSLVNSAIARFTVAAGTPAKPIKQNVYWNLERSPRSEQFQIVSERLRELD